MLNNAIEHSRGENIHIIVSTNALFSSVVIVDDGAGVFQTLTEYMAEHGWDNPCTEDALIELYKGKITCDASRHSGEGIFTSSKVVDEFAILYPINMVSEVKQMIRHVSRGQVPENVRMLIR